MEEMRVISLRKDRVISITKDGKSSGVKLPFVFTGLSWGKAGRVRGIKQQSKTIYTGNFIQRLLKIGPSKLEYLEPSTMIDYNEDVDLDSSIIIFDKNKKFLEKIYFNNLSSSDDSIKHYGDDRTGSDKKGKLDNEVIKVNLEKASSRYHYLVVILNSYSQHTFKDIEFTSMRIYSNKSMKEDDLSEILATYKVDKTGHPNKKALVLGVFYRTGSHWDFKAVGEFTEERSIDQMIDGSVKRAISGI